MPKGRFSKPKPALEEEEVDSGWVWDKYKSSGGGGAPLKSVNGGTVTNLRSVIRGSVDQLAHSSPTRRSGSKTRSYEDDDDSDDGYDNNDDSRRSRRSASNERRNNNSSRRSKYDSDDDEDDYTDRKVRAARSRSRSNDRMDRDSREGKQDRRSHSLSPDPALAALLSPKKGLGSALRDMNVSQTPMERQAKARKELDYQNALRAQIDEKKRRKEEEDRKADEIKERELEEYLNQYYKGAIPPHVKRSMKKDRKRDQDDDDYDDRKNDSGRRRGSEGYESDNRRRRNVSTPDDLDDEEDERSHRREKRSPEKQPRNNKMKLIPGLDFDNDSDKGGMDRPPRSGRRGPDSSRSKNEGWVSQTEYDELSLLCDRLLKQQDDLQKELKVQSKLIRQLQTGKGTAGGARKTLLQLHDDNVSVGSSKNMRAKSAVEERRGSGASVGGRNPITPRGASTQRGRAMPSTTGKEGMVPRPPSQDRRPSSTNAPAQQRDTSRGRPAPPNGVGFGSRVTKNNLLMKEDPLPRNPTNAGVLKTPRSLGKPSPTKDPRGGNMFRSNSSKYIRDVMDDEYNVDSRHDGQNSNQLSGIAKLAAMRGGQPIVAVHDDSDNGNGNGGGIKSAMKKSIQTGKSSLLKSAELSGNTEFLRIGGEEVDIISGDQLDRLLDKAKKARGTGGRGGGQVKGSSLY